MSIDRKGMVMPDGQFVRKYRKVYDFHIILI